MHRRTTLWTVLSALTVTAVTGPMALAAPAPTLAPANASATASAPSGDSDLERSLQGAAEPLRTPSSAATGRHGRASRSGAASGPTSTRAANGSA